MVSSKRSLGSYYSPEPYARLLVRWALRGQGGRVMDPSFGGCAFLRVALDELEALGEPAAPSKVFGADIDLDTAVWAAHLESQGVPSNNLKSMDFLDARPDVEFPRVEAVVGNPPYVRHHWLTEKSRESANEAMRHAGVDLSGRASLWAYFTVHAARFVAPGGRLAFLLPGSLLTANYSDSVIRFLCNSFAQVHLIRVGERIFSDADEETVVLLASGQGGACQESTVDEVEDLSSLESLLTTTTRQQVAWQSAEHPALNLKLELIGRECRDLFLGLESERNVAALSAFADVRIGTVTGANSFFVRNESDFRALRLPEASIPVVSRTSWLQAPTFGLGDLAELRESNKSTRLLLLGKNLLPSGQLASEIAQAELEGLHRRHHLKRQPWWSLSARVPDAFVPYMVGRYRGITTNRAAATSTNAIHQLDWRGPYSKEASAQISLSSWSAMTELSAELFGRHYGGGVLKLEVASARRLLVLRPEVLEPLSGHGDDGANPHNAADQMLENSIGLNAADIALLRRSAALLRARRLGSKMYAAAALEARAK